MANNVETVSRIFCDTSFFFACLVQKDINHDRAREMLKRHAQVDLVTTWEVVSETVTLLRYRGDYTLAVTFLDKIKPHLDIITCDSTVREEAERVFKKFAKDKRLSFCDCISFVVLKLICLECAVFSFDRDFKQFGLS